MSELLLIANALRSMSDTELSAVIRPLGSASASLGDLFDVARALTGRRELERRIRNLDTASLTKLRSGGTSKQLEESFLASGESAFESARQLANELQPIELKAVKQSLDGSELSNYETQLAITEILFACERHWLEAVKAGLRAVEAKELAQVLKLETPEVQVRFQLAKLAGLVEVSDGRYVSTAKGLTWLDGTPELRWQLLAEAIWDLPDLPLSAGNLIHQIRQHYPLLDPNNLEILRFGHLLGLLSGYEPLGLLALASQSLSAAAARVADQQPEPVSRIVLQGDLSIVSPGPLTPQIHKQIDLIAQSEDLGLACRFRLSLGSVLHAMEMGMSAEEIGNLLRSLAGVELPQPVTYLLNEAAKKFGELTVRPLGDHSRIDCQDQILLTQIRNETALSGLMLKNEADYLVSRLSPALIYFNLRDAGYPAIQLDLQGKVLTPRIAQGFESPVEIDIYLEQAKALLTFEAKAPSADDHIRQLQFALKNKLKVGVRVDMPEGLVEITMTPLGIAGGRFRGRDVEKEAERTLPLSRIKAVWLS